MTRRGQMPSGGSTFDLGDRPRRKLPSLQKMIEDYSRKAWYTVPAGKAPRGVDPNAPREPAFLGSNVRLAARVIDEKVGGNPANMGVCDCAPCGCDLRDARGWYLPCEHDLACPHHGDDEEAEVVSAKLRALVASYPALAREFKSGIAAVHDLAGLTPAESRVAHYKHEGLSYTSIAFLIDRKEGTVKALYSRATFKLEQLADTDDAFAAVAA